MNALLPLRLACVLPFALFTNAVAATPPLSELVAAYTNLTIGPAKRVTASTFKSGHMTYTVANGIVAPVNAGGREVGIFYVGDGTFTYVTTEKVEFPLTRHNARTARVKIDASADQIVVRDELKRLLLLRTPVPAIAVGGDAPSLTAAFQEHRQAFANHWTTPVAHRLAIDIIDDPSPSFVHAEVVADQMYVHEVDENWRTAETLDVLRHMDTFDPVLKRALFAVTLSEQPIGRDIRDTRKPRVTLSHVDLTLVASEGKDATLTVTETLVPQSRPASVFRFDMYQRVYVESGREPRTFRVKDVTDGEGRKLSFHHERDEIVVSVPEPAPVGKPLTMRFDIDGDFLYRPGGDSYWELGTEPWFPQPELNERSFTFHAVVKVKKPFVPFAPGKTLRRESEGEYNVVETQLEQPVQLVALLAGKYQFEEETRKGITIRVASYAGKNAPALKQLRGLAFTIIDHYEVFLGPFPFPEFNIIEKNDFGYGQAPAATMFITKEAFSPLQEEANRYVKGVNERFAHEIAHQWWGHVVKMPSYEEQWLTESFSEYSAALFMRSRKGDYAYRNMLSSWRSDAREATEKAPIALANRLQNFGDPYGRWLVRKGLVYDKGAYLLAALHNELGDQMFLTFLKSYQRSFRWKYGTTRDVAGLLKFLTKKDYTDFLEKYYWGTAMPEIKK